MRFDLNTRRIIELPTSMPQRRSDEDRPAIQIQKMKQIVELAINNTLNLNAVEHIVVKHYTSAFCFGETPNYINERGRFVLDKAEKFDNGFLESLSDIVKEYDSSCRSLIREIERSSNLDCKVKNAYVTQSGNFLISLHIKGSRREGDFNAIIVPKSKNTLGR